MNKNIQRWKSSLLAGLILGLIIVLAFLTANYLDNNPSTQIFITNLGYFGVFSLALIAGLNFIFPFPAASFVPVFTSAGLSLPAIIFTLTVGTLLADYLSFIIGSWARSNTNKKHLETIIKFEKIYSEHRKWLPYLIFLYALFIPLPNEMLILPLAILGVSFRFMIIPLFLGNFLHQTVLAYGFQNIFDWWF